MNRCRYCNSPIPARVGPGRPGFFCSDDCRRHIELRIKRLRRRLERLEERYDVLVMTADHATTADSLLTGRTVPEQRRTCAALIDAAENELVAILTED